LTRTDETQSIAIFFFPSVNRKLYKTMTTRTRRGGCRLAVQVATRRAGILWGLAL